MTYREILPADAPRDEWLTTRLVGIGASDIAAILGMSPYESRASLYYRKRGELEPQPESPETEWGTRLESAIRDKFAANHPELGVTRSGLLQSSEREWQICTPDAIAMVEKTVEPVELKTADRSQAHEWGPDGSDVIPMHYRIQNLWQVDVLGANHGHVAVLIGGNDYREYVINRDSVDIELMREAAETFWRDVTEGNPPDIDAHEATTAALKELHPEVEDVDVTVERAVYDRYLDAIRAYRTAETDKRQIENELRDAIGDGRRAVLEDGTQVVSRSVFEKTSFAAARLKEARPDVWKQFVSTTTIHKLNPPRLPKESAA